MTTQLQTEQGIVRVPTGTWTVDPIHSSVGFEVKHMMIRGKDRVGIAVRGSIDRTEFGLTWQQPLAGGGLLVGDQVALRIDISAVRA